MATTITVTAQRKLDLYVVVEGTIAFSGSYPTGGEPISFSGLSTPPGFPTGLQTNKTTPIFFNVDGKFGYWYQYDYVNNKLKIFSAAAAAGVNPGAIEHTAVAYSTDTNPTNGPQGDVVTFWAIFLGIAP